MAVKDKANLRLTALIGGWENRGPQQKAGTSGCRRLDMEMIRIAGWILLALGGILGIGAVGAVLLFVYCGCNTNWGWQVH